ncbi:MAG: hypothetical protein M1829_002120, partial [Trizodia sp. TS-e1964]
LKNEKKKRKRGKKLNLLGEEESGPQFFSPGRIAAARDFQAEKNQKEEEHRQGIGSRKLLAASKKAQKEKNKIERIAAAIVKRSAAAAAKIAQAAKTQARKEEREKAAIAKLACTKRPNLLTGIRKSRQATKEPNAQLCNAVALREEEVVQIATSRGRRIQLPERFAI